MVTNTLVESDVRPRKRTRTDEAATEDVKTQKHRLFSPFRALGLVTNHIPFVLQARSFKGATEGPRINIVTCLGRSWAMWEGGKMTLLFIGKHAFVVQHKGSAIIKWNLFRTGL